jgi:hypothetical protein
MFFIVQYQQIGRYQEKRGYQQEYPVTCIKFGKVLRFGKACREDNIQNPDNYI